MEFLTGLQSYVEDLQVKMEEKDALIQKLTSRLDESNLNFKYETLIKTYNEAERENKALKAQLANSDEQKRLLDEARRENTLLKAKLAHREDPAKGRPSTRNNPQPSLSYPGPGPNGEILILHTY